MPHATETEMAHVQWRATRLDSELKNVGRSLKDAPADGGPPRGQPAIEAAGGGDLETG